MKSRLRCVFLLLFFVIGNACGQSNGMVDKVRELIKRDSNITALEFRQDSSGGFSLSLKREPGHVETSWVMPAVLGGVVGAAVVFVIGMVANKGQQLPARVN